MTLFTCVQAALAGNVAAGVCTAQVMDLRGDLEAGLKFWGRAARQGHPESQYRLGKVSFVWLLKLLTYIACVLTSSCKCSLQSALMLMPEVNCTANVLGQSSSCEPTNSH